MLSSITTSTPLSFPPLSSSLLSEIPTPLDLIMTLNELDIEELSSEALGSSVVAVSDQWFAPAESLLKQHVCLFFAFHLCTHTYVAVLHELALSFRS
ncbi:hypothetical protein PGT21_023445 [Puccinia graminis f. sp. tritici]|uniref:Uncharacterized protein n=1 Tax=Puccinia graminis f. sp. tritici TaxID=56615 RepID=A0A5B0MNH4_PUCGR|nr:hypothetical protein PGT21_023445 [Puccinia graminis f. sp. tritici]